MSRTVTYIKALAAGAVLCIGGPALVQYVTPTAEEIRAKYNPELRERAEREGPLREAEFDAFVNELKEASKSDKPIWVELKRMQKRKAEEEARRREESRARLLAEAEKRRSEIRASGDE
ncbi:CBP4-domain-containing protein [Polyplosphaeria fusca]|uniref:Cytochrome b mRNA-processing protein 4 n=1 Tax=Polyplosphaeria fusca TaxID=682080 RepID=A0A9P4R650_9PLEO|nr:CBP4-domain-containing protein [Polyplosphaeria fusca]